MARVPVDDGHGRDRVHEKIIPQSTSPIHTAERKKEKALEREAIQLALKIRDLRSRLFVFQDANSNPEEETKLKAEIENHMYVLQDIAQRNKFLRGFIRQRVLPLIDPVDEETESQRLFKERADLQLSVENPRLSVRDRGALQKRLCKVESLIAATKLKEWKRARFAERNEEAKTLHTFLEERKFLRSGHKRQAVSLDRLRRGFGKSLAFVASIHDHEQHKRDHFFRKTRIEQRENKSMFGDAAAFYTPEKPPPTQDELDAAMLETTVDNLLGYEAESISSFDSFIDEFGEYFPIGLRDDDFSIVVLQHVYAEMIKEIDKAFFGKEIRKMAKKGDHRLGLDYSYAYSLLPNLVAAHAHKPESPLSNNHENTSGVAYEQELMRRYGIAEDPSNGNGVAKKKRATGKEFFVRSVQVQPVRVRGVPRGISYE